jgi:DsbC/DsbD-like thiol-disulfide interchange protein
MRTRLVWMAAAAATVVSGALAQPEDQAEHARPRLVSEFKALEPGKTNSIAVTFDIDPHWHLYWKGRNDSGFAPNFTVTGPPGYTIRQPQWPAPKRNILPGNILDHIYEGRLTLILPVEVPKDASGSATFKASGEWLVCMEACIPGSAELTLTVPIGGPEAGKPGPDAARFAETRERTPKPLPKESSPVSIEFRDGVFIIKSSSVKNLAFYPAEDCVKLTDAIADGATDKGVLSLHLAEFPMEARLKGVIDLNPPNPKESKPGTPTIHWVDIPIAAPGGGGGPGKAPEGLKAPAAGS